MRHHVPRVIATALGRRASGLLLGYAADRLFGDPRRYHPVAGFGQLARRAEATCWRDDRAAGAAYTLVLVGGTSAAAAVAARMTRRHALLDVATIGVVTWVALGGRTLGREAHAVRELLESDDLPGARRRLTHLVGRDTASLASDEVVRATVESVAENTSDAVVAPLVSGAVAGLPGLVGYRAANTLDAMVGHTDARYQRFGWASARFDDVINLVPARMTAALAVLLAPSVRGDLVAAWRVWRRDAGAHPSPNAGPVEAAFAGALGVRLGGVNSYRDRVEDRHVLGDGRAAAGPDIGRTTALADRIGLGAVLGCAAGCVLSAAYRSRRQRSRRR